MCLVTEQKYPEILEKDLTVYKKFSIEDGKLFPWLPDNKFLITYEVGKLFTVEMVGNKIPESVHDQIVYDAYGGEEWETGNYTHVHAGFHSALTIERLEFVSKREQIGKCTIPAGSEIYRDKTGLVASNAIYINHLY